ncbi:MAG: MarP family serine protease [Rubrobacter sp.]|nr:MarP family serine protease [Rubrobacter sp.]
MDLQGLQLNALDFFILFFVLVLVVRGARTGFLSGALSLAGLVVGAVVGSRVAPFFFADNEEPVFRAIVTLGSVVAFIVLGDILARAIGGSIRSRLTGSATLALDGFGGAALGFALSLVLVWVASIASLQAPPLASLHPTVERSQIVQTLNDQMPSRLVMEAIAQLDPLPQIQGPSADVDVPDEGIAGDPEVLAATESTARITGIACGYGVGGSGWVATPNLVVTNAHVVAGESSTRVQVGGTGMNQPADVVLFDETNDVAVLRVDGIEAPPLQLAEPQAGEDVAVIGFPGNGPLDVQPGRTAETRSVISGDAYGAGPVERTVTSFRVDVRPGNSGGPAVNADGAVTSTIFASRADSQQSGYGIPSSIVADHLQTAQNRTEPVDTSPCAA